jgi:phage-related minor tail protein
LLSSEGNTFAKAIGGAFDRVVVNAEPFIDRRAGGGPVHSGSPYLVGERGPEVFTPGRAGSVSPSMNASQIVDAVHEVRDEMASLRRQFGRALSGSELVGARA